MTNYYICGGSDTHWQFVAATTLTGAKRAATRAYQCAVGGKIEVATITDHDGHSARYETVAVKHGYNAWQSA